MNTKSRRLVGSATCLLLVTLLLLSADQLGSAWLSNWGWVKLFAWLQTSQPAMVHADGATDFDRAATLDPNNLRAYWGAGIFNALAGSAEKADENWRHARAESDDLVKLGEFFGDANRNNAAFIALQSAIQSGGQRPNAADFATVRLCQRTHIQVQQLAQSSQALCQSYIRQSQGSLLYNGQFDYGASVWSGEFFFATALTATVRIDALNGLPPPSLEITGLSAGRHYGLYQVVTMAPGSSVHFQGAFRVADATDLQARILYIEWTQAGKTHGNQALIVDQDHEWFHVERTFTLPADAGAQVLFFPVLLEGVGEVGVDKVSVVQISNQDE